MNRLVIGVSGSSGAPYARRVLMRAVELVTHVDAVFSSGARAVIREELGLEFDPDSTASVGQALWGRVPENFRVHPLKDLRSELSSGSSTGDAMAIVPCSMGTLGRIASGISSNLLERAADVMLKERRPLVLVPRETPLNLIHLENMTRLARAGAIILPAAPGFYHRPKTVDELVDFVAGRVFATLGIRSSGAVRWDPDAVPPDGDDDRPTSPDPVRR